MRTITIARKPSSHAADRKVEAGEGRPTRRIGRLTATVVAVSALATVGAGVTAASAYADASYGQVCAGVNATAGCQPITASVPDLAGSTVGTDTISSLSVSAGFMITAWSGTNYSGRCQVFGGWSSPAVTVNDLRAGYWVGNDQISSIGLGPSQVPSCQSAKHAPPVTATACQNSQCQTLTASVPDLSITSLGQNTMTWGSGNGGQVAYYSQPNYQGICQSSSGNLQLSQTNLAGKVASIALNHTCHQDVELCRDINGGGDCVTFRTSTPELYDNPIGDNQASSIWVPKGFVVNLYMDKNYGGLVDEYPNQMQRFSGVNTEPNDGSYNIDNKGDGAVPNDSASSLTVSDPGGCVAHNDPLCTGIIPGA